MAEQKLIKLKINEREVQVPQGTLVIEATRRMGTEVPSFCYYPGLSLQAACRMCLVRIEKMPKLQTACTVPITEGMVVTTASDEVKQARKSMVEMLLGNHPLDCPVCDVGGECELQDHLGCATRGYRHRDCARRLARQELHRWRFLAHQGTLRLRFC